MKKIGLIILVVAMAFGLAGCAKDHHDADPVGTWVISWDWECDGSAGLTLWHIFTGGSFIDDFGGGGTWAVDRSDITLTYDSGNIYGGTVDGDSMDGTMIQAGTGRSGCWAAERSSHTP